MNIKNIIEEHEHSLITFGVVLIATLFGCGLLGLLLMSGIWLGREHAQAEQRCIQKYYENKRANAHWYCGFELIAWDYHSFVNNMCLPILLGSLIVGVYYVTVN